jgi:hypothetical protein
MRELQLLFQDLDAIVVEQEPMVQNVEQRATQTHEHLEQGNAQIDRAIVRARAARKKKWICLGICVAVILVLMIIILVWARVTGQFVSHTFARKTNRCIADNYRKTAAVVTISTGRFNRSQDSLYSANSRWRSPCASAI